MKVSKIEVCVTCETFQDVRDLEDFLMAHGVDTDNGDDCFGFCGDGPVELTSTVASSSSFDYKPILRKVVKPS